MAQREAEGAQLLLTSLEVRAKWASLTEEAWLAQMETRKAGSLG